MQETNLTTLFTDIADAIREKESSSEPIQASTFPTRIENLPSGGGADLSEYFYTEITSNTTTDYMSNKIVKKAPDVTAANNVTSLSHCYYQCPLQVLPKVICGTNILATDYMYYYTNSPTVDASGLNTANVTTMRGMFQRSTSQIPLLSITFGENFTTESCTDYRNMFSGNSSLTSLDLHTFSSNNTNNFTAAAMFQGCSSLMHLDMRNFSFNKILNFGNMFNNVPDACEIIVKDNTQKTWFSTNFSRLTNVKTVSEL